MLYENGNETLLYDSFNFGISLKNSKKNRYLKIFLVSILLIILLFLISYFINRNNNHNEKIKLKNLIEISAENTEDNECLIFDKDSKKCISCNIMFNLVDGICEPNYSIKEIITSANKKTKLINDNYINYVKRMFINNTEISPVSYYTFEYLGDYVVYILIDISSLNSILSMFKEVKK